MNKLPIIVFTAVTLGCNIHAGMAQEATPAATPTEAQEGQSATTTFSSSTVLALSDAECIAIADYMRRINRAAMNARANSGPAGNYGVVAIMQAIAAESAQGVPDDFRRYVAEYCQLTTSTQEKRDELTRQMNATNVDDALDIGSKINQLDKKLREDKLALSARYSRASLIGGGWESNAYEHARQDLILLNDAAKAYLAAAPLKEKEKADSPERVKAYLQYLCQQPLPELTAEQARSHLERMEILKLLDPGWKLENSLEFFGVHEGTTYAIYLPQDSSTDCSWQLAGQAAEHPDYSVEWKHVPTASLKKPYPNGKGVQLGTPLPSTPETLVALVHLKKAGTASLRFICTRESTGTALATKVARFYVRRVDDYRPLMETDPLPEPEPAPPPPAAGVASLSDNECLAIHRYLQMLYCHTAEECAKAVEKQEHLQVPIISAEVLPGMMLNAPELPKDFHDYQVEYHNLYIGLRAASRALDRKEYNYRYGQGITKEQRKELRQQRKELQQREEEMWKTLKEKYPRAIILANASAPFIIDQIYRSYSSMDAKAKRFYAEHPDMKDVSDKLSRSGYFRYLAAERARQEQSFAAARRTLERLDALRLMKARPGYEPRHRLCGEAGKTVAAIILPMAPETGFTWSLDSPLPNEAQVQVEWHNMRSERLLKLRDMGVLYNEIPETEQLSIATIRMKQAGEAKLRFICTRPGDDEALLAERAELEIRAQEKDEE